MIIRLRIIVRSSLDFLNTQIKALSFLCLAVHEELKDKCAKHDTPSATAVKFFIVNFPEACLLKRLEISMCNFQQFKFGPKLISSAVISSTYILSKTSHL